MRSIPALLLVCALSGSGADERRFTDSGELIRPEDYREWVFLSSGLGMTYGPNAPAEGAPQRFDNVYANPSSYREFIKTGKWPDGTVLILEVRDSASKGSINQHGHFQTDLVGLEANVKDTRRFSGNGWAFFDLSPRGGKLPAAGKMIPSGNRCEQCHSKNGAVDNTFVQFYPELALLAKRFGTYREP